MPFIAFLGCDGSGKSAVIQGLKSRLEAEGHEVTLGHWRPQPLAKNTSGAPAADDPHGQRSRGFAASVLKLFWLWANWWLGWFSGLRAASTAGYLLFDRFHGDLIVDPTRYRYGGPLWLTHYVSHLMPQPDLILFLDAAPDVLLARKQEVTKEALESARRKYIAYCEKNSRCRILDASQPLESVISVAAGLADKLKLR